MVRRLSFASLDSGAESSVYGGEPPASARRAAPAARPPWGGATRDIPGPADLLPPAQVRAGCAATRRNLRHVGHRPPHRKMVCKGHPCINAADGNPMIRFAPPGKHCDVHGREG
jgi:hypothetical protein